MKIFAKHKNLIQNFLETYLKQKQEEFCFVNSWNQDVMNRLLDFTLPGKMIRGGLVLFVEKMLSGNNEKAATAVAAAMELAQSSLLIHDDIMDKDLTRRGAPSFFAQYKTLAENKKLHDPYHFGEAMGICAGDIGFFLLYDILGQLEISTEIILQLFQIVSRELTLVGLAQMQDVYFGTTTSPAPEKDILSLYRHKTARYTFSLPLTLGATLANASHEIIEKLAQLGEHMGIIFQLRDDELDTFGDERIIGKPVGSDIRENKKTFYHALLHSKASPTDLNIIQGIFGNPQASALEIDQIKKLIFQYEIDQRITHMIRSHLAEANTILASLKLVPEDKEILETLLNYLYEREK